LGESRFRQGIYSAPSIKDPNPPFRSLLDSVLNTTFSLPVSISGDYREAAGFFSLVIANSEQASGLGLNLIGIPFLLL
jgi:hypothetical protein